MQLHDLVHIPKPCGVDEGLDPQTKEAWHQIGIP